MASQRDELMTVEQILAELCGVSERTFYRWRELGRAPKGIRLPIASCGYGGVSSWPGSNLSVRTRRERDDRRPVLGCAPQQSSRSVSYEVRWVVGGRQFSRTRATKALAESFLSELRQAAKRGEAFDTSEGLPLSMRRAKHATSWFAFVLAYVDVKWPRAAAKTRNSMTDALATVTAALVDDRPGQPDPLVVRRALRQYALVPAARKLPRPAEIAAALGWLDRASLPVAELEKPRNVRAALDALTLRLDGTAAAATTIRRKRAVFYNVLGYAAELEELSANPLDRVKWKPPKVAEVVDRRVVVNPGQARELLIAVTYVGRPWRGRHLRAFFACMYFAALRPGEVKALRKDGCYLPVSGWGRLTLSRSRPQANKRWTDSGEGFDDRGLKHRRGRRHAIGADTARARDDPAGAYRGVRDCRRWAPVQNRNRRHDLRPHRHMGRCPDVCPDTGAGRLTDGGPTLRSSARGCLTLAERRSRRYGGGRPCRAQRRGSAAGVREVHRWRRGDR